MQPWKAVFVDLERQVDELFEELIYRPWAINAGHAWQPPLDLLETPDAYLVLIDLPEVAPEAVQLRASERNLAISGQRPASSEECVCHRSERKCGTFHRSVSFPHPIDPNNVQAECRHGTYRIRLPKKRPSPGQVHGSTSGQDNLGSVIQVIVS
jgi:HSP20 family protein